MVFKKHAAPPRSPGRSPTGMFSKKQPNSVLEDTTRRLVDSYPETTNTHISCILAWFKGVGCLYEGGMAAQGVWSILYIYKELISTRLSSLILCAHPIARKLSRLQLSDIGTEGASFCGLRLGGCTPSLASVCKFKAKSCCVY
jgi:hypothetical protein